MADDGLRPGDVLAGRYRLIDRIGSGGMAVIWRAHDDTLERLVAIKVLDLALSGMRDLVRREAWAAARLNHPDVAGVHDFVVAGGIGVLVMQLVEGDPLADRIALGPLPWREAVRIGLRVAGVLELAHRRGVIHRDITPDNVVVNGDRVTVLDFGIAARVGEPDEDSTGASFGTPAYVAPERLDGTPAHTATDIYALGAVMFEMLTGRVPFRVSGWDDVAADHGKPSALRVAGVPAQLGPLVEGMLARNPAERPSAAEVIASLQRLGRTMSRRPLAAFAIAVAAAAAALIVWAPWQRPSVQDSAPPATSPPRATSASPPASLPPVPARQQPTAAQARQALLALLDQGESDGAIRSDAALDLRQVIQNATHVSQLDNVRVKIADREREGSLSPTLAASLRPAVDTLAAAMRRA